MTRLPWPYVYAYIQVCIHSHTCPCDYSNFIHDMIAKPLYICICVCTYIYIYIYIYIHTHICTYIHTWMIRICCLSQRDLHGLICQYMYACMWPSIRIFAYVHVHKKRLKCMHGTSKQFHLRLWYTCVTLHASIHVCIQVHTYMCTYKNVHVHTQIYAHSAYEAKVVVCACVYPTDTQTHLHICLHTYIINIHT
jgi:hypothetical protein